MNRSSIAALLLAAPLSLSSVACAPPATATPSARAPAAAPAPPPPEREGEPIAIEYRVSREGNAVILAGQSDAVGRREDEVKEQAAHSSARAELFVRPYPREDGTYIVEVHYKEMSADGAWLDWTPVVHLTRGKTSHASTSGDGWSRAIELTAR